MKAKIFATIAALLIAVPAFAADPSIGRAAFSLPDNGTPQDVFKPDAPKIVLHVEILNPSKAKVAADWIAVKTGGASPNYKIDSAELDLSNQEEVDFSLSKPNNGWPLGDYRVDLSIDGEKAKSVAFKVAE